MNSIVIVGRAVRDAEVRYSTGEKSTAFGNYTLAVDRPYKKDGEKETDFIMCKVVGKTAEFAEKYITKGVKMIVRGRMQIDNYTDRYGNKRQVSKLSFLGESVEPEDAEVIGNIFDNQELLEVER